MPVSLLIDARCLQDVGQRERASGRHLAELLRRRPAGTRAVALLDHAAPALAPEHAALFDALRWTPYDEPGPGKAAATFLQPWPLNPAPLRVARLLGRGGRRRAAILHAPLPPPDAAAGAAKLDQLGTLAWLGAYDLLLPATEAAARSAEALLPRAAGRRAVVSGPAEAGGPDAEAAAARFWAALDARPLPAPAAPRGARPDVALLSPLPPVVTGVADYSAAVLEPLSRLARVTAYTDAPGARVPPGVRVATLSPRACLSPAHDAAVHVLGNNGRFHGAIHALLLDYGGSAVLHDARLTHFYASHLGMERALAVASAELGRAVSAAEVERWMVQERDLPTHFLSEVVRAADPVFVHSAATRDRLRGAGAGAGARVEHLPFATYRVLPAESLSVAARAAARTRLELPPGLPVVATFGHAGAEKAPHELVWALGLLRGWGLPAMLAFVGEVSPALRDALRDVARVEGVAHLLRFAGPVGESAYRAWLRAADAGVQLRAHSIGSVSGALMDCVAAGLPTVSNDDLAAAIGAPATCPRVPDSLSAVLVAEQLAPLVAAGPLRPRDEAARRDYLAEHSAERYARRLLAGLGFAA